MTQVAERPDGGITGSGGNSGDGLDVIEVRALLDRASRLLDRLWHEARLESPQDGIDLQLAEASHGVHRALIALGPDTPFTL